MMVFAIIAYSSVAIFFTLMGYCTTSKRRLNLPLFMVASALWPLSLLVIVSYVGAERLGLVRSRSVVDWLPAHMQPERAPVDERELPQPVAEQASKAH